jgi:hypothetical protein
MSNYQDRVRAKNLLRVLLKKAEAVAEDDKIDFRFDVNPAVLHAAMQYVHRNNLAGVDLFQDNNGKWIADIILKNVPPGYGNRVGTHADHPHATRQEAVETAVCLLSHIVKTSPSAAADVPDPAFTFFDHAFIVPRVIIERAAQLQRVEPEYLAKRLLDVGHYATRVSDLTEDERIELHSIIVLAMVNDIIRWPPSVSGEPLTQERLAKMTPAKLVELIQYRF